MEASIRASVPIKPESIEKRASEIWDAILRSMPADSIVASDAMALQQLSQLHAEWEYWDKLFWENPEENAGAFASALKASQQFTKLAVEFGLTPASRAKIRTGGDAKKDDPFAAFASLAAPNEN